MIGISFLQFLSDNVLAQRIILNMHHRIVKIRIKFLSLSLNRFHPDRLEFLKH